MNMYKELPERFIIYNNCDTSTITIENTLNGRCSEIGLYAYEAVIKSLTEILNGCSVSNVIDNSPLYARCEVIAALDELF